MYPFTHNFDNIRRHSHLLCQQFVFTQWYTICVGPKGYIILMIMFQQMTQPVPCGSLVVPSVSINSDVCIRYIDVYIVRFNRGVLSPTSTLTSFMERQIREKLISPYVSRLLRAPPMRILLKYKFRLYHVYLAMSIHRLD